MDYYYNKSNYLILKENITDFKSLFSQLYYDNKEIINKSFQYNIGFDEINNIFINDKLFINPEIEKIRVRINLTEKYSYLTFMFINDFNKTLIQIQFNLYKDLTVKLSIGSRDITYKNDKRFTVDCFNIKWEEYKL